MLGKTHMTIGATTTLLLYNHQIVNDPKLLVPILTISAFASIVPDNIGIGNIVRNVALIRSNTQIYNEYLLAYFRFA